MIICLLFAVALILNVGMGLYHSFYRRKCSSCGKRMKHVCNVYDKQGNIDHYEFVCPHCGHSEKVDPIEIFREEVANDKV